MKPHRRLKSLAATLGSLLLACSRASTPLPTQVGKPLQVAPRPVSKPLGFAVVFAGPTGEVAPESELQVLFSRPLRAMTTLAETATPAITMKPAILGKWRWLGTQALVFSPAQSRLPYGTEIEVEVAAGTRALDGSRLEQAYRWKMRTPAPKLVDVDSNDDVSHLRDNSQFELTLDQPVALDALRRALRLEVTHGGGVAELPFQLTALADKLPHQGFRVVPQRPLPRTATVKVMLVPGLAGLEGPLATTEHQSREFSTIAPLRVDKWDCDRATPKQGCDARSGISLEFNNPVLLRGLRPNITVDGRRAKLASWHSDDDVTAYVHIPGPFPAGSAIQLRVAAATRDEFGQTLGKAFAERVVFDDFFPRMDIGLEGEIFEATQPSAVPLGMVNVTQYERLFLPLTVENLGPLLAAENPEQRFVRGLAAKGMRLEPTSAKHPPNKLGIDFFEAFGANPGGLGPALIGLRYPGVDAEGKRVTLTDAKFIQRTNLGVTGQIGRFGSVLWVTELDSGKSVVDAEVAVLQSDGKFRAKVNTDAQGIARFGADAIPAEAIQEPTKLPIAFLVRRGPDLTFRQISDLMPEWNLPVSVDRSGQLNSKLMLFTERGLYRPGERVDVKAILRDEQPRGLSVPKERSLKLELMAPDNHAVATKSVKTTEFGTAAAAFGIPLSGMTGQWSVRVSQDKQVIGSTLLTVGEYRPVELEVQVLPAKSEILRGGALAVQVQSKTLFGMAAAGAKVRIEAYRERAAFVPRGAEAYVTDASDFDELRVDDSLQRAQLLLTNRELDREGRTETSIAAELPAARGAEWIHVEAEVTDAGQNPVASGARTLVHPAEYYVGLRRVSERWVSAPSKLQIDVAAFGTDGARRNGRSIDLELLRRKWSIVRREVNGVVQTKNEPSDEVLGRCQVKTAATDVRCNFDLNRAGSYFVVARSRDDAQRLATAAQAIFVVGAGQPEVTDSDDHRVELVPDKAEYRAGDVAKILVKSAITDVDALVVVGRSDVFSSERRHLTGTTPIIEVPINEDMRPNLFVMAQLVTGRKRSPPQRLEQPDLGAPTYRMGWAELKIGSAERRLSVDLQPSSRAARPGAKIDLAVTLRDQQARPVRGEVTLWAVDEGVLALGNYQIPDPYDVFLGSRPLMLLPMESRQALGRRSLLALREELGLLKGSSGAGGGESPSSSSTRQDFRATAFFLPNLLTDATGQVKASMSLPDGLTTYRVFALAVTGTEQYGFASDRIVTSKPLMVRPTIPRFFRDGDQAEVGVVVSAQQSVEGEAAIDVQAQGLLPKQQHQNTKLVRGGSVELMFPLTATSADACEISIEARSLGQRDALKLQRPIRRAIAMEVVAQSGETRERAIEKLGDLSGVRGDQGYLELQLSNSFLGGASGGFQQLIEYPYGCSEQISSRLMALQPLAELAQMAGIALPKERSRLIEIAIAELLRRQRHDGGFGMWIEADRSEPWVTAHVLGALQDAKQGRPYLMPAIERGLDYLHGLAAAIGNDAQVPSDLAGLPYVADVLYRYGKGDPGLLSRLFESRQKMPVFSQAMLLHAYAIARHDAKATAQLVGELERLLHHDGGVARVVTNQGDDYARLFDSNSRTEALVTWALATAQPEHPMLVPLARGILSERRQGRWATTQDSAFSLMALNQVRIAKHLSSSAIEAAVSLGDRQLYAGTIGGKAPSLVTERVPIASLQNGDAPLLFSTEKGPLLYEARLNYVPKSPATLALDAGFALERSLFVVGPDGTLATTPLAASPGEPSAIQVTRGQSFVVELAIVVPRPRDYVVVDSPIPAGFEAIDVTHRTSSGWMRRLDRIEGFGPDRDRTIDYHRDLRDDRVTYLVDHFPIGLHRLRYLVRAVTKGNYALPPARVEAMYAPEHFGTTMAERIEIR